MRTKAERKRNTWKKIFKKLRHIKSKDQDEFKEDVEKFAEQPHRLAKNKIEQKQEKKGKVSISDQRRIDKCKEY